MSDAMDFDESLDAGVPCGTIYTTKLEVSEPPPPNTFAMEQDVVNHPNHYTMGKIEVIDFITDQSMDYLEGKIVKYISRYKYKNGLEDLKKARWYINKLIEQHEGK